MKKIRSNLLKAYGVQSIGAVERHYGEFKITAKLEDNEWYTVTNGNSELFSESEAERLIRKHGEPGQKLTYTFIHNPSLWEEPYEDDEW